MTIDDCMREGKRRWRLKAIESRRIKVRPPATYKVVPAEAVNRRIADKLASIDV